MSALVRVIEPGFLTTVQDLGRPGMGAMGVPVGGAADAVSLRAANRAVGNADGAAGLEMTLMGATVEFDGPAVVAIGGAECEAEIVSRGGARRAFRPCAAERVARGDVVRVERIHAGVRVYLAIAGGVDAEGVLGSRSTLLSAAFGGLDGRALRPGDVLPFGVVTQARAPEPAADHANVLREVCRRRTLRAVGGPHADRFAGRALAIFWESAFTVSSHADRVGLRLEGPAVATSTAGRLRSEAMMHGAVEVPEDGKPIVLMCEHPTTGGYPVIACVAAVDLPTLGQLRPGDTIRFERVTPRQALDALRDREHAWTGKKKDA